jgi:hypothetical protein
MEAIFFGRSPIRSNRETRMSRKNREEKARRDRDPSPARNRDPALTVSGIQIPVGAIAADPAEQAANNSYLPPAFYQDEDIECVDCCAVETWTAEQKHWWYEIAKGPVDSTAVRCRACRRQKREAREAQHARSEAGRKVKEER